MRAGVVGRHGAVVALAVAVVVLRLPFLLAPEGADEGGYLAVARQWHGAGPSLYGHYWVDRPPLLIALFQLCSAQGGLPAVRVLGALAAAVAVLGVADASRLLGSRRSAVVGAGLAAALFVSPQLGTVQVNGELFAAPFVAWSVALWVRAVRPAWPGHSATTARAAAVGAGALACAALLVKQNMVDPLVFGALAGLVAWRTRAVRGGDLVRAATGAAGGFVSGLVLVGTWTTMAGASLAGVYNAMYPFRVRAAEVLATLPDQGQAHRSGVFLSTCVTSGMLLVVAAFAWASARARVAGPAAWGLAGLLVWVSLSMVLSGGFWDHYLVEAIVPVAIAGGVVAGSTRPVRGLQAHVLLAGVAVTTVVTVALTHWALAWSTRQSDRGVGAGTAIAAVAAPGDTVVSVVGDAETVDASGLSSPYPYLWTLPAQVDDPHLARLTALLSGPHAPTWLVPWDRPSFPAPVLQRVDGVVATHYRIVGVVCGHPVLLRDGVDRPALPAEPCSGRLARW